MVIMAAGCSTIKKAEKEIEEIKEKIEGVKDAVNSREKPETASSKDEVAMSTVVWLDPDISGWPITEDYLADHTGDPGHITYWKSQGIMHDWKDDRGSVGNPWIFIPSEELGEPAGKYYATTWEHITRGNPRKPKRNCNGGHIKKSKIPKSWTPTINKAYPQMYSGMARRGYSGTVARSLVKMQTWL